MAGYALGIWICGCSLLYKRELWASKGARAHSTKSLKISGCKRWCPKDLWVPAPTTPVLTHSLHGEKRQWRKRFRYRWNVINDLKKILLTNFKSGQIRIIFFFQKRGKKTKLPFPLLLGLHPLVVRLLLPLVRTLLHLLKVLLCGERCLILLL